MASSFVFLLHFLISVLSQTVQTCFNGECQLKRSCTRDQDCAPGLFCDSCIGADVMKPICIRGNATPTNRTDLPFNKYAWLTTHNSFATGKSGLFARVNQDDSVTSQLQNGVRGLMLDFYDFRNDVWECHSYGGVCHKYTAFRPAIYTLREVEAFLSSNPNEVITIFIEDYVHAQFGLSNIFKAADLFKYWFPINKMPHFGEDWPTLAEMIAHNRRLIVFTSAKYKFVMEGIAHQWRYVAENHYGNAGVRSGKCSNREESRALSDKSVSLVLMNYFPSDPSGSPDCKYHSKRLFKMLDVCATAAGNRYANYLAVDFYKKSDGGGTFQAVDILNSRLQNNVPK